MAEVKWIKIVTDVFDDEKILMIESMPDADALIVIWFKLLCLAGKQNNSGVFQMGQMPYTDEMFATVFRRPLNTVRLALQTFERFGMVEIVNNTVTIPNWDKHQSLDAYEKRKERDRLYQQERRAAQKQLAQKSTDPSADGSSDVASQIRGDKKKTRREVDRESIEAAPPPRAMRHKYGSYKNVLLSDEEFAKLTEEFPHDYSARIERLSEYIASTGKSYKSHLATIRSWARKDAEKQSKGGNVFMEIAREEGLF